MVFMTVKGTGKVLIKVVQNSLKTSDINERFEKDQNTWRKSRINPISKADHVLLKILSFGKYELISSTAVI